MDFSAVSVSKAVPSTFYPSFSDQSHLQFYGHGRRSFLSPSRLRFKISSCGPPASKPAMTPARAFCISTCAASTELTAEEALMKELADLKLQMKQKKKELKAHMKEDKKNLKMQMKEEKKRKKQKDAHEGKTKMTRCQSESSSSSSESCDEGCTSVSMKVLRQNQSTLQDARVNGEGGPVLPTFMAINAVLAPCVNDLSMKDTVEDCVRSSPSFLSLSRSSNAMEAFAGKTYVFPDRDGSELTVASDAIEVSSGKSSMVCSDRVSSELGLLSVGSLKDCILGAKVTAELENVQKCAIRNRDVSSCKSRFGGGMGATAHALPSLGAMNRIEVCAGGKCKKAGSEELLFALQGQIPRSANVEAVSCKCMGKCSMAVNVRVLKEDTNPQHHSHVGVEDGSLILSHHFGLGCPSVGLPSLSPKNGIRAPSPLVSA